MVRTIKMIKNKKRKSRKQTGGLFNKDPDDDDDPNNFTSEEDDDDPYYFLNDEEREEIKKREIDTYKKKLFKKDKEITKNISQIQRYIEVKKKVLKDLRKELEENELQKHKKNQI
jgi:hypothetical protein